MDNDEDQRRLLEAAQTLALRALDLAHDQRQEFIERAVAAIHEKLRSQAWCRAGCRRDSRKASDHDRGCHADPRGGWWADRPCVAAWVSTSRGSEDGARRGSQARGEEQGRQTLPIPTPISGAGVEMGRVSAGAEAAVRWDSQAYIPLWHVRRVIYTRLILVRGDR